MNKQEFSALPEEKQTAMVATALFSKRADGHIEPLSATEAAQFLGCVDSYPVGQGSFNLLVPKQKITEFGLSEDLWGRAATARSVDGRAVYDLDSMTGVELIGRLEYLAGKNWNEVRDLKATTDASREGRKIA